MAQFTNDTFTDTAATNITSHTGEVGATHTKHPTYTGNGEISNANRLRATTSLGNIIMYTSGIPATAEYDVEADLHVESNTTSSFVGVAGRMSTSATTFYYANYARASTSWELYKGVAGTFTLLGTYAQILTVGQTYHIKLELRDATKKVYIDGVERISSTDNAITAAGRAGWRLFDTVGDAVGRHLDNLSATDAGGGDVPIAGSDTQALTGADAASLAITAETTDTHSLAGSGAVTLVASIDATDTQALTASEAAALTVSLDAADAQVVSAIDAVALGTTSAVADSQVLGSVESAVVVSQNNVQAADAQALDSVDAVSALAIDTAPSAEVVLLATVESVSVQVTLSITDVPVLSFVEALALLASLAASDVGVIVALDSAVMAPVAQAFIATPDSRTYRVPQEERILQVRGEARMVDA